MEFLVKGYFKWQGYNLMTQFNIPMQPLQDLLVATKCLLVKSEDWRYEKEWRLLSSPSEINEKERIPDGILSFLWQNYDKLIQCTAL